MRVTKTYPSNDLDVRSSRAVARSYRINDSENILLHHADEILMVLSLRHVTKMLDEIHDICTIIHGILQNH